MPVDNELYDRMADSWWDEAGFLHLLHALTPPRLGYMRRVLAAEGKSDLRGLRVLDVGCGGGILAGELARLECRVAGIDPSVRSLEAARARATAVGLEIDFRNATGDALPFPEGSFDVVCCFDVLEHVPDVRAMIAEAARVLQPGGIYFFETINRTLRSWFVLIKLLQEWPCTRFMPPRLHDWKMFIKPAELQALLAAHGLEPRGVRGLVARVNRLRALALLRARKRGALSHLEATRRLDIGEGDDTSEQYIGHAVKAR